MSIRQKIAKLIGGAKTYEMWEYAHPCDKCKLEGKFTMGVKLLIDVSAEGERERMTVHCPKCGPIKELFARRPEPRYQDAFTEAVTGRTIKRPKEAEVE